MRNENGDSKGFGFILFTTAYAARTAISEMNGRIFAGKPIYVAIAQRKEERKLLLQKQFNKAYEIDSELEEAIPTGNSEFLKRRIMKASAFTQEPLARQIKHSMIKKLGIALIYPKIAEKIESVLMELGGAELSRMTSDPDLAKKRIDGIATGILSHSKALRTLDNFEKRSL